MPTPSMPQLLGRVRRSADSRVRLMPLGSLYVILHAHEILILLSGECGPAGSSPDGTYFTSLVTPPLYRAADGQPQLQMHGWGVKVASAHQRLS